MKSAMLGREKLEVLSSLSKSESSNWQSQMLKVNDMHGALLWNSIPREVRESTSLNYFQKKIATCNDI